MRLAVVTAFVCVLLWQSVPAVADGRDASSEARTRHASLARSCVVNCEGVVSPAGIKSEQGLSLLQRVPAPNPTQAIEKLFRNNRDLFVPGNPNLSPIFWSMLLAPTRKDNGPEDLTTLSRVSNSTIMKVRDWIAGQPHAPDPYEMSSSHELTVKASKRNYAPGEILKFRVAVERNCYLTLIAIDQDFRATVVFPNAYMRQNHVAAGTRLSFPAPDARFVMRAGKAGRETVVALCVPNRGALFGIRHQFTFERFTSLGSWRSHIAKWRRTLGRVGPGRRVVRRWSNRRGRQRQSVRASYRLRSSRASRLNDKQRFDWLWAAATYRVQR